MKLMIERDILLTRRIQESKESTFTHVYEMVNESTERLLRGAALTPGGEEGLSTAELLFSRLADEDRSLEQEDVEDNHISAISGMDIMNREPINIEKVSLPITKDLRSIHLHDDENKYNSKKESYDSILLNLYNNVQLFLQKNGFSQIFFKVFRRYINHLIEDNMDPLADENVLSLQVELTSDYKITRKLEEIMSKFLLKPDNATMKLTFFETNRDLNVLNSYFIQWRLNHNTRTYNEKLIKLYEKYIKDRFLKIWLQRYKRFTELENYRAIESNKFRLQAMAFDKLLMKYDSVDKMEEMADTRFLNHMFNKIKVKQDKLNDLETSLRKSNAQNLLERQFKLWKLSKRKFQYYGIHEKRRIFKKWSNKIIISQDLDEKADLLRSLSLVQPKFNDWCQLSSESVKKEFELNKLEHQFIKRKAYAKMTKLYNIADREKVAYNKLNIILLKSMFKQVWLKRFNEKLHYYSLVDIQNEKIQVNYFNKLKKTLFLNVKADDFNNEYLKQSISRMWKLKSNLNVFEKRRRMTTLRLTFKQWDSRHRMDLNCGIFETNSTVKQTFINWKQKTQKIQDLEGIANRSVINIHRKNILEKWYQKHLHIEQLKLKSSIFDEMHLLQTFKKSYHNSIKKKSMCDRVDTRKLEKHYLIKYFNVWKENKKINHEVKLQNRLNIYMERRTKKLEYKYFVLCFKKYQFYQYKLLENAKLLHRRNLETAFFDTIVGKLIVYEENLQTSVNLNNTTTLQSAFSIWVDQLNKNAQMKEILREKVNEQNISLISDFLSIWSMRYLKMSRNNESVQTFRKRWDRAVLRGILMLWSEKYQNSPKRKVADRNNNITNVYLSEQKTPARKVSQAPDTIPGSVTVRRTKMDAMISHYRRAGRAIPSPLRNSGTSRLNTTRISPSRPNRLDFGNIQELKPNTSPLPEPPTVNDQLIESENSARDPEKDERFLNGSPRRKIPSR